MIKVVEHGKTHKVAKCPKCGCRFEHVRSDMSEYGVLLCPECYYHAYYKEFEE